MQRGQHMTDETKAKISASMMGKNMGRAPSDACIEASRKAHLGVARSPETCAKISAAKMGHLVTTETRAKIGVANTGRVRSPEVRARISLSEKGRVFSPEHCAKISVASKGKFGPDAACWKGGEQISIPKHNAKRRLLGFNPLNSRFPGCEGHHINPTDVIHMPKKLHKSIYHNHYTGQGMVAMNALALAWLEQTKEVVC